MKQATLCLLIKDGQSEKEILLAMKKRGFGIGKWNGVGGKLDFEKGDKDILSAAIRETKEEIGVLATDLEKAAVLSFYFPYNPDWNQDVHVYLIKNWEGNPVESEEMRPEWFKAGDIPFSEMWDDDKLWLPEVLAGKKLKANFTFREGEKIADYKINFVNEI